MSTAERTVTTAPGLEPEAALAATPRLAWRARWRDAALIVSGADLIALLVAQCAALALTANLFTDQRADWASLALGVVVFSVLWLGLLAAFGTYDRRRVRISTRSFVGHLRDVLYPLIIGGLIVLLAREPLAATFGPGLVEALTVGAFLGLAAVLVPLARVSLHSLRIPALNRPERTVVVGSGPVAGLIAQKLLRHRGYGMALVGYLDDEARELTGCERLGRCGDLAAVCEQHDIDRVVLADPDAGDEQVLDLVRSVRNPSVQVSIVPRYFEVFPSHATLDDLEGVPGADHAARAPGPRGRHRQASGRRRRQRGGPAAARAGPRRHRRRHPPGLPGPGALPPGPARARGIDVRDREVPDHGRRRRGTVPGARRPRPGRTGRCSSSRTATRASPGVGRSSAARASTSCPSSGTSSAAR